MIRIRTSGIGYVVEETTHASRVSERDDSEA
jgi:hypothetical protein